MNIKFSQDVNIIERTRITNAVSRLNLDTEEVFAHDSDGVNNGIIDRYRMLTGYSTLKSNKEILEDIEKYETVLSDDHIKGLGNGYFVCRRIIEYRNDVVFRYRLYDISKDGVIVSNCFLVSWDKSVQQPHEYYIKEAISCVFPEYTPAVRTWLPLNCGEINKVVNRCLNAENDFSRGNQDLVEREMIKRYCKLTGDNKTVFEIEKYNSPDLLPGDRIIVSEDWTRAVKVMPENLYKKLYKLRCSANLGYELSPIENVGNNLYLTALLRKYKTGPELAWKEYYIMSEQNDEWKICSEIIMAEDLQV